MSAAGDSLRRKIQQEAEYYRAQNENLKDELAGIEATYRNNVTRYSKISSDYEDSLEMVRILRLLTR